MASLSGNSVIVKKINLPVMSEADLAESIHWEAEQYIPFDIQDVNLDYQILDAGRRAAGHDGRAARRRQEGQDRRLHRRHQRRSGKKPVVVDVDAFALQNAFEANYARRRGRSSRSSTPAPAPSTSTSCRAAVALHARRRHRRQRLHRGGAEGTRTCRSRAPKTPRRACPSRASTSRTSGPCCTR